MQRRMPNTAKGPETRGACEPLPDTRQVTRLATGVSEGAVSGTVAFTNQSWEVDIGPPGGLGRNWPGDHRRNTPRALGATQAA